MNRLRKECHNHDTIAKFFTNLCGTNNELEYFNYLLLFWKWYRDIHRCSTIITSFNNLIYVSCLSITSAFRQKLQIYVLCYLSVKSICAVFKSINFWAWLLFFMHISDNVMIDHLLFDHAIFWWNNTFCGLRKINSIDLYHFRKSSNK